MDELGLIQKIVLRDHPNLESNILSSSKVLHVWLNKNDTKGLNYFPNFHLIFQSHSEEKLTVKLVTFHGKTVDSLVFKAEEDQEESLSFPGHVKDFLSRYSDGLFLCQGVSKDETVSNPDYIAEFLNDSIVIRSQRCKFTLKNESPDPKCEECAKILPAVKLEPMIAVTKIEQNGSEVPIPVEDLKFTIKEAVKDDEKDEDYNDNDNYDDNDYDHSYEENNDNNENNDEENDEEEEDDYKNDQNWDVTVIPPSSNRSSKKQPKVQKRPYRKSANYYNNRTRRSKKDEDSENADTRGEVLPGAYNSI